MILIASGAYLDSEFVTEIGLIPPAFLPVGNQRLYNYQIQFIRNSISESEQVFLSIPNDFVVDDYDNAVFKSNNIILIRTPKGISLGQSVLYAWNSHGGNGEDLTVLLGDSLFDGAVYKDSNLITAHPNHGFYKRAKFDSDKIESVKTQWASDRDKVLSGLFRFRSPFLLMRSILECNGDFIEACKTYDRESPLHIDNTGNWFDFGHINSFFQSRTRITTQRVFNHLNIQRYKVRKSSEQQHHKITAELQWYKNIPRNLRVFLPSLLEYTSKGPYSHYEVEYLYLMPLSDLYVFGRLEVEQWFSVLNSMNFLINEFKSSLIEPEQIEDTIKSVEKIYLDKTIERLDTFVSSGISFPKLRTSKNGLVTLHQIAKECLASIPPVQAKDISVVHGDLCFSNTLFDMRTELIKCIDPRGIDSSGNFSIYGDIRYDLAKAYHSIYGLYDFIIAGLYEIEYQGDELSGIKFFSNDSLIDSVSTRYINTIVHDLNYTKSEIHSIVILLFLSMLPLHSDRPDRQLAFIANALRLYNEWMEFE